MKNLLTSIKKSITPRDSSARATRIANRKAIAELRALSDAELHDIGISRSNITHSVLFGKENTDVTKQAA